MSVAILEKHDSKKFKETVKEDPTISFEAEGGWAMTRPRYTRKPPRLFTLGFTDMSDAEKESIAALYETSRGSANIIAGWHHPVSGLEVAVRFKKGSVPKYAYKGMNGNHRWDISDVVLEEL